MPTRHGALTTKVQDQIENLDFSKPLPDWAQNAISDQLALDAEAEQRPGQIGFMIRGLVTCSLPYKDPKTCMFQRINGNTALTVMGPPSLGIPYGKYPRLMLAWVTTEAVRTKSRELRIGGTLKAFLREVGGVADTGGASGSRTRFLNQMARLFGASITIEENNINTPRGKRGYRMQNISVGSAQQIDFDEEKRLWTPIDSDGGDEPFNSCVVLNYDFFQECINSPVPLDLSAYKHIANGHNSVLPMDIYLWLTYRMSYLRGTSPPISWVSLMKQFGSNYTGVKAVSNFKRDFTTALRIVQSVYPAADIKAVSNGLILRPSPTHVPKVSQGNLFS